MKRSDVRAWLHQAALDVARLAELRTGQVPQRRLSVSCAGHDSFFDAEREARALAWLAGVTFVVVEVRDADVPPGIEALFVVCTEESVNEVSRGREVVFRAEAASVRSEAAERAVRDALLLANRALQILDQGSDQSVHNVLSGGAEAKTGQGVLPSDEVPERCGPDGALLAKSLALALAKTANRVRTAPIVAFEHCAVRGAAHALHELLEAGLAAPSDDHDVRVGAVGLNTEHRKRN